MERGTDREREALAREWAAIERRRALATRFLFGTALVTGGVVLLALGLAAPVTFCVHGAGVPGGACGVDRLGAPGRGLLVATGGLLVAAGAWRCRDALRTDPYA